MSRKSAHHFVFVGFFLVSCFIRFEKCAVAISPVDLGTLYLEDWTGLDWTGLVKRGLVKPGLVIKRGLV